MGLKTKARTLDAYWKDGLPNSISIINIEANATSTHTAYLDLGYEFVGFNEATDAAQSKANKVF